MKRLLAAVLFFMFADSAAHAAFVSFTTVANANLLDANADGVFEQISSGSATSGSGLSVRMFNTPIFQPQDRFEERSVAEFNLSSLTSTAGIASVAFRFSQGAFTSSSTRVDIFGYVGDGQTTLADATAPGVLLGSYNPAALGLGQHEVSLNLSAFSNLLGTSRVIGLRFQGIYPTNAQFYSLESARIVGASVIPPTLVVDTAAVPEPSAALLAGIGLASLAGIGAFRRSRTRAS